MIDNKDTINALAIYKIIKESLKRGKDIQVTHSKDGIKVFEIDKKLTNIFKLNN